VWIIRPTLVPTKSGAVSECKRAHLIASTIALNGYEYTDPEVKGRIETVVVPFMFPADELDVTLFHDYDKRNEIAMGNMTKQRDRDRDENKRHLKDARVCLDWRRKGRKGIPNSVKASNSELFLGMTPRELATNIDIMEKRMKKRLENDKRLIVDMAQQTEDLSNLMVARLPIAYCVLLMQINNLVYTERKDQ